MVGHRPGVINIVHAVRQTPDHGFESRILTRKRYYRDAGMDRARRINTGRNFVLRDATKIHKNAPSRLQIMAHHRVRHRARTTCADYLD